jgi:hypothetical protein
MVSLCKVLARGGYLFFNCNFDFLMVGSAKFLPIFTAGPLCFETQKVIFCVGVVYSGEYDVCDVTLSVYPHRESLKNMPGHRGQIHTQSNITNNTKSVEKQGVIEVNVGKFEGFLVPCMFLFSFKYFSSKMMDSN